MTTQDDEGPTPPLDDTIQIGGMRFHASEQPPPDMTADATDAEHAPHVFHFEPVDLTLEQAVAAMPFAFGVPTWVPDGFVREDVVRATLPKTDNPFGSVLFAHTPSVDCVWRNASGQWFGLAARQEAPLPADAVRGAVPVLPGGVQAQTVSGHPAALITQQHGIALPGDTTIVIDWPMLRWSVNGVTYNLRTMPGTLSTAALLAIAESIDV